MPARRLLFTFMESDNLSDLRRRIGLHEQTLTLWYSSLMYGSLRRLERGQEEVYNKLSDLTKELVEWRARGDELLAKQEKLAARKRIIAVLKNYQGSDPSRHRHRQEDIAHLDDDSLRAVLRKAGIPEEQINANLKFAKDYIRAPKDEQQEGSPVVQGYSRPERKSSRRCSRKQMETEIKQKEKEVKQKEEEVKRKETEVSIQIRETEAAIHKTRPPSEDHGRPGRQQTTSPHSIPVNMINLGNEDAASSRPTSKVRAIQRVQLDQFDPRVLEEHGISWEPDPTDERYITLKQELSEEMIKTLYKESKARRATNAEEYARKKSDERRTRSGRASSASAYIDRENSYLKPDQDVLRRRASDARVGSRLRPPDDGGSGFSDHDSKSSISSHGGDADSFLRRDRLRRGDGRSRPEWSDGPWTDFLGETKPETTVPPRVMPLSQGFSDRRKPEIFITSYSSSPSRSASAPHRPATGNHLDEEDIVEVRRARSSQRHSDTPC